jgi:hypothetical protein
MIMGVVRGDFAEAAYSYGGGGCGRNSFIPYESKILFFPFLRPTRCSLIFVTPSWSSNDENEEDENRCPFSLSMSCRTQKNLMVHDSGLQYYRLFSLFLVRGSTLVGCMHMLDVLSCSVWTGGM